LSNQYHPPLRVVTASIQKLKDRQWGLFRLGPHVDETKGLSLWSTRKKGPSYFFIHFPEHYNLAKSVSRRLLLLVKRLVVRSYARRLVAGIRRGRLLLYNMTAYSDLPFLVSCMADDICPRINISLSPPTQQWFFLVKGNMTMVVTVAS
jgi:hypothetical protein